MINTDALAQTTFNAPAQQDVGVAKALMQSDDISVLDFGSLHAVLRELRTMGADGALGLEQLAYELGVVLGTEVKPHIGSDYQFGLVWTVAVGLMPATFHSPSSTSSGVTE